MGWVVTTTPLSHYPWELDSLPTVQEAKWVPEPVWTDAESLACIGARRPDEPIASRCTNYTPSPACENHAKW